MMSRLRFSAPTALAPLDPCFKEKELLTGEGCFGVVIPWQLCRTIGPLLRDSPWQVLKHSQGGISIHPVLVISSCLMLLS